MCYLAQDSVQVERGAVNNNIGKVGRDWAERPPH